MLASRSLLLAPVEGFVQSFFCHSGLTRKLIMLFWPILVHFWCSVAVLHSILVVTLVTLKKVQKIQKKFLRKSKISKKRKITRKSNKMSQISTQWRECYIMNLSIIHQVPVKHKESKILCGKLGAMKITPNDCLHQDYLTTNLGSASDC